MIQDTIQKIESKLKTSDAIKPENKSELIGLLAQLRLEIDGLARTNAEGAQTVAGFTEISTHEATRIQKNPQLLELSLQGLSRSVEEFEDTHPQLVGVVNRISTVLANMGI